MSDICKIKAQPSPSGVESTLFHGPTTGGLHYTLEVVGSWNFMQY